MAKLKRQDAVPLYEQAADRIRAMLDSGEAGPGDPIPNETELCERFGVSRITVRRAVTELVRRGFLEKKQGKGTFVTTPGSSVDLTRILSFSEACRRQGGKASAKVLRVRLAAAEPADERDLNLAKGQKIVETVRVRLFNNIPVMIEINHFSTVYSYLTECDLESSLYSILQEFGVRPSKAVHDISLCRADAETAEHLGIPKDTPLLHLKEVIYDQKGRPLHSSRQWIRGDRFTFRI